MACPFDEDPVDVEAQIIRGFFRRERVIRPRIDVFAYPNEYLRALSFFKRFISLFNTSFKTAYRKCDKPRLCA